MHIKRVLMMSKARRRVGVRVCKACSLTDWIANCQYQHYFRNNALRSTSNILYFTLHNFMNPASGNMAI